MRAGLVGPNGAGKTTLLKIMLSEEPPDSGNVIKDKTVTIGHLAQDIVAGNQKTILNQVLKSYPEVFELESKIKIITGKISNDSENIDLINTLGEYHSRFDAIGGWSLEKKKKYLEG